MRFLAPRPRSEYEIRRRLRRAEVPEDTIDSVLSQLRGYGLVDDQAFAEYWVEQRQTFRPRGARLVAAELRRHGVASSVADAASAPLEADAEGAAYRIAAQRAERLRTLDPAAFRSRLSAFLARRGFAWEVISSVVDRVQRELQ